MKTQVSEDRKIIIQLGDIAGTYLTFGPAGQTYDVLNLVEPAVGTAVRLRNRAYQELEETDYPLDDILEDPLAH